MSERLPTPRTYCTDDPGVSCTEPARSWMTSAEFLASLHPHHADPPIFPRLSLWRLRWWKR